jgi:endonuclease III
MTKRLRLHEAIEVLEKEYGRPRGAEHDEDPLLDHLLVGVLTEWVDRERAQRAVRALSESFLDLNETRVSPLHELAEVLAPVFGSAAAEHVPPAALAFRTALQDVYDATHGLDLEPLRGREPEDVRKFLKELPHTMGGPAAAVVQRALGDEHLALTPPEARVLSRLGLLPRASTQARIRQSLEKQVKAPERLRFAWAFGSHASEVCHAKEPECERCLMLPHCPEGALIVRQRAIDRKRAEAKRLAEEKKKKAADAKAARIAAKVAAAAAKKKAILDAKAARIAAAAARRAAEQAARVARAKAKAEAAKAKVEAAKAKAAAKALAAKQAAAAKKAAAKKAKAKKPAKR